MLLLLTKFIVLKSLILQKLKILTSRAVDLIQATFITLILHLQSNHNNFYILCFMVMIKWHITCNSALYPVQHYTNYKWFWMYDFALSNKARTKHKWLENTNTLQGILFLRKSRHQSKRNLKLSRTRRYSTFENFKVLLHTGCRTKLFP